MAISPDYLEYVLEQMRLVRGVTSRRMFGGLCLFYQGKAFGLIGEDVLYLKVDDSNRADFEAAGMSAFAPFADKPEYKMGYYEVPIDVLEDRERLRDWSLKAIAVSKKAADKKRKKT
jgi:DNA transformation protein and related proteins